MFEALAAGRPLVVRGDGAEGLALRAVPSRRPHARGRALRGGDVIGDGADLLERAAAHVRRLRPAWR
ncbi:MAG: hypothetical protein ACK58T_39315, partial [Phycisphaerae bacterium]